jgi:two-component system sensor histidine kinase KdpD
VLELLLHPAAIHLLHQQGRGLDHVRHVLHRRAEHGQPHQPPADARDRRTSPPASDFDALLRVTQSAALAAEPEKGLAEALRTINELLNASTALIVREQDRSLPKAAHRASSFQPSAKEWGVVAWSYENKQCAGRFTDTLPESAATWFPLQTATSNMGVLGVQMPREARLDFTTRQTIEAFALQLALVLEKEHFIQAVSHAEVLAQSEKLHRTLLDSVSHELKTPSPSSVPRSKA